MNRNNLKKQAPKARREFIAAVTARAARFGIGERETAPMEEQGELVLIKGEAHPKVVGEQRQRLAERIRRQGFVQTMEAVAYTWFNRLAAIRFMEIHDYLDHGFRVLSHPDGGALPEILDHAERLLLPGLDRDRVIDLKLAGNREEELYRLILTAQCNALHGAMPFLFERIDDETELLLPDNLLHSDSPLRRLVEGIPEADWREIEIIGWLYQFYISEKKDQVIGKVVKSEDIPAATQLFTPNWIVKYMVQNSLGHQWLATYPDSAIRGEMAYYIEPAEQTSEVQSQLAAITPESLDPEAITLMDPACGSGHILVEAYDLFKAIYQERGYRPRDIPRLILEKNLFGLDIDDRAAQLAGFALLMKARADDRRILDRSPRLNVMALQSSQGLEGRELAEWLGSPGESAAIRGLLDLFREAKTFGSLIQVPEELAATLPRLRALVDQEAGGDMFKARALEALRPLAAQVEILARQYDCVVANPPYMGSKHYSPLLKQLVRSSYGTSKSDLYACFMMRNITFSKKCGSIGMITIPNWMVLSGFEKLRSWIFRNATIETFVHNGRGVWGSDFGSCSFTLRHIQLPEYIGIYKRLFDKQGEVTHNDELKRKFFHNSRHMGIRLPQA